MYTEYKFHEEIDSHTASYLCNVANVTEIEQLSLRDINNFLRDLNSHYNEPSVAENNDKNQYR